MSRNAYGSRRDFLPGFMRKGDSVERYRVRVLDLAASQDLEKLSLNRFPHTSAGLIGWTDAVYTERVSFSDEAEGVRLIEGLLSRTVEPVSEVVLFWGTLVMPTVVLTAEGVTAHAGEILKIGPDFWIYLRDRNMLVECAQDGRITLADIPSA